MTEQKWTDGKKSQVRKSGEELNRVDTILNQDIQKLEDS